LGHGRLVIFDFVLGLIYHLNPNICILNFKNSRLVFRVDWTAPGLEKRRSIVNAICYCFRQITAIRNDSNTKVTEVENCVKIMAFLTPSKFRREPATLEFVKFNLGPNILCTFGESRSASSDIRSLEVKQKQEK